MKLKIHKRIFSMFLLFVLSIPITSAQSNNSHRVLLIAREVSEDMGFMIKNEVNPMIELLNSAGYQVDIADESGNSITADGRTLNVSLKFDEVNLSNYSGILVPCIMAFGSLSKSVPQGAVNLLKEGDSLYLPMALQHSLELLRPSGLTANRKFSFTPGVVRDRWLITSSNCPMKAMDNDKPIDTPLLIATFISAMEERE